MFRKGYVKVDNRFVKLEDEDGEILEFLKTE
jgi:hypothetical protein